MKLIMRGLQKGNAKAMAKSAEAGDASPPTTANVEIARTPEQGRGCPKKSLGQNNSRQHEVKPSLPSDFDGDEAEAVGIAEVEADPNSYRKLVYGIEWSRTQIMCRAGLRGAGQSVRIQSGPGTDHPDHERAIDAADKWVEAERRGQGLPPSEYQKENEKHCMIQLKALRVLAISSW